MLYQLRFFKLNMNKINFEDVFNLMQDDELINNLEKHLELLLKVKNINGQRKKVLY